MKKHEIAKAVRQAFPLGQTYWQQVDSELAKHWRRGEYTLEVFNQLIEETTKGLDQQPADEPVAWVDVKDTHEGPYDFHGKKFLPKGKHDLYTRPKPASGTEQRVCEDIAMRQYLGVSKYGTTVEKNPLTLREWLQHAYEECLDQAVYLRRAIEEMDK